MRVLILANGDPPDQNALAQLREEHDVFVAADGALNRLPASLRPDVTLGDFDSLDPRYRTGVLRANLQHVEDQERSDLQKALDFAMGLGPSQVTLVGVWGDRSDHSLVAVSLLVFYSDLAPLQIVRGKERLWLAGQYDAVAGSPGDTLSLIAFTPASGVNLSGVRWPLEEAELLPGSRGVSNELTEEIARLSVRHGTVIACHARKS